MILVDVADNDYEIGEEPEMTWGWSKFKGKPKRSRGSSNSGGVSGWISKRKKLNSMIELCSDVFKKAGHGEETTSETTAEPSEKARLYTMCYYVLLWDATIRRAIVFSV